MYDSPGSLQDVCVDFICENLGSLCEVTSSTVATSRLESSPVDKSVDEQRQNARVPTNGIRVVFKGSEIFLHTEIAEQLLTALCAKKKLCDQVMSLFDVSTTRLRRVCLSDASQLTLRGLKVLRAHKITDLETQGLKVTVNDLIGCLGEWTLQNLRSLNVAHSAFMDGPKYCVVVALAKLQALQTLNVSNTDFNRHGLEIVASDLPQLENLDISNTRVDDITPLKKLKHRLKSLAMYNLKYILVASKEEVVAEMTELQTLDMSEDRDNHPFEMFVSIASKTNEFLNKERVLDKLTSLDISGKDEIGRKELKGFVRRHPHLRFLGLVHSEACYDDCFINPRNPEYNPNLQVAGTATEEQIILALRRYYHRPLYVQKCLYNLFRLTPTFSDTRVDIIKLVLPGMKLHPQSFGVQMAATACLYNLTKGDLAARIHPAVLAKVVELSLVAMENFPNHYQLQKNTLLTLCSDRILQDVPIEKYRCARLVLDSLCAFEDPSMNRMSVAICSILAAKISTCETSRLGSRQPYMRKLLSLVRGKMETKTVDITMKFTLSALWNLTDESPTTCIMFLNEGGLDLFLGVLVAFPGEATVETKVLGLINNIAEVPELRTYLLKAAFIDLLRNLLHSSQIDVSYFAAGIMAHLASQGKKAWQDSGAELSWQDALCDLGAAVAAWQPPEGEMVAYRSFHPFLSLLQCYDAPQVQLWAVWAIHHVCTKNASRYCPMLEADQGSQLLRQMYSCTNIDPRVKDICADILSLLRHNSGTTVCESSP
ncbi:protein zyg-11 homolog B-like [Macrosteles quadrilineatus]|uniref:protein zyg-11 homolog B-like n=1 Tax=Macrosteles quadrilineatus TaxID=74068 RepID=UPI0023E17BA2|nr:protein zyg-11 homolog B-like [Macrosteles quadrilineatus]